MKTNYNLMMLDILDSLEKEKPLKILLHSCCGPCSTEVISRLTPYFDITVFYYNPNIEPQAEYVKRKQEQIRFIKEFKSENKVDFLDCDYNHDDFLDIAKGLETEPEGGNRCHRCYELRLTKTAEIAKEKGYDYFGTTLTVSPYKNAQVLNQIGENVQNQLNVKYLFSDFKKENGYKKSIEYSKKYKLYRQNYCGCEFSRVIGIEE